jgi:ubiquinone/menaquinone biosynthesis C-methylase UbiE
LVAAIMRVANRGPTHALIEALDIQAGQNILDVGCGDGTALAAMPRETWRCGLDQSEMMLSIASKKLRRDATPGTFRLRHGDMLALPFGNGSFDRILASNVLYFCADIPAFVDECRRVARPGAVLGIYVTAAHSMAKWAFAGHETHRHFTCEQLGAELFAAGIQPADLEIRQLALPGDIKGLIALARLGGQLT